MKRVNQVISSMGAMEPSVQMDVPVPCFAAKIPRKAVIYVQEIVCCHAGQHNWLTTDL